MKILVLWFFAIIVGIRCLAGAVDVRPVASDGKLEISASHRFEPVDGESGIARLMLTIAVINVSECDVKMITTGYDVAILGDGNESISIVLHIFGARSKSDGQSSACARFETRALKPGERALIQASELVPFVIFQKRAIAEVIVPKAFVDGTDLWFGQLRCVSRHDPK